MKLSRPSVLLVDDVEANLVALEAQLESLDCDVVRAGSGNEALRQLLKREFAVMLLDVQMPEMDGFEVARYARENPATAEVPIIFVTAMLEAEHSVLRGYGSGAVDFLFKPINPHILRGKVRVFLELSVSRRKLAAEVEAHRKTLAELEAFNYSVSHDLKAPLRPIDGFSQALLEDYGDQLDEVAKGYLGRIRTSAQRMAQLIDDLLRLSKINRAEINVQPMDLAVIAREVVHDLVLAESEREVAFTAPDSAPSRGDPGLLRILLENLLRNAWKFTSKKRDGKVEFGVRTEGDESVFYVRDNGVGFDATYAGKLFRPFQRLHKGSDFEGTGIGLAIVGRIVGHHGGRVWAEGAVGEGATFSFTLGG